MRRRLEHRLDDGNERIERSGEGNVLEPRFRFARAVVHPALPGVSAVFDLIALRGIPFGSGAPDDERFDRAARAHPHLLVDHGDEPAHVESHARPARAVFRRPERDLAVARAARIGDRPDPGAGGRLRELIDRRLGECWEREKEEDRGEPGSFWTEHSLLYAGELPMLR